MGEFGVADAKGLVAFRDLVGVMDRLRSPQGCPWDREQTHESLVGYLIEETYEVVDAIETGTQSDLVEELGDLLLQVVFHARIGEEESPSWDIDDVCRGITDKLIRRHRHVFAGVDMQPDMLEQAWHDQKVVEKSRTSVTEGIPASLPALSFAMKLTRRCRDGDVPAPVNEELVSKVADILSESPTELADQLGDVLAAAAYLATQRGLDPEELLRAANRRGVARVMADEIS